MLMRFILSIILCILIADSCKLSVHKVNDENDKKAAIEIVDSLYSKLEQNRISEALKLFNISAPQDSINIYKFLVSLAPQANVLAKGKLDHWSTSVSDGLDQNCDYKLYYLVSNGNSDLHISLWLRRNADRQIKLVSFKSSADSFLNN